MDYYISAKNFLLKNARPLDLSRWYYLFENGDKQDVLEALKAYQNIDGGFGSALEPDCWNTYSTPMQTWVATRIIEEIHLEDKSHPIIKGILDYLASGDEFDGERWHGLNTVKTNNDYPHAPWWSYQEGKESDYNPTASLIGFILKYADKESALYTLACNLIPKAYTYFENHFPLASMHEAACFVELYESMKQCQCYHLVDLEKFKDLLQQQIKHLITYNTEVWDIEYICKPSQFITSPQSDFYLENKEICDYECQFIKTHQNTDGTWRVTWNWNDYQEEWAISKNWWKSDIIINNIKYLKAFER